MRSRALRQAQPLLPKHATPSSRRHVHISATPAANAGLPDGDLSSSSTSKIDLDAPDAQFEVIGAPYSLLSASLAPSQTLYTRRGTLVGVSGKVDNAVSRLSPQNALTAGPLGIPFLYQKITSASPITALISTRSPLTSFTTVHLDGTTDWMIAQRTGLLAWTGQTLTPTPMVNFAMSVAHWGQTRVTGRGLLALAGKGQVYQVHVRAGESYTAHPANILAYAVNRHPPSPYRFKSSVLRLEIPGTGWIRKYMPETRFWKVMRESESWQRVKRIAYTLRTWSRRTIWGDRLFLQFHGPTTLLLQSRGSSVRDALTARDVHEISDIEPGITGPKTTLRGQTPAEREAEEHNTSPQSAQTVHIATVRRDTGEVKIDEK